MPVLSYTTAVLRLFQKLPAINRQVNNFPPAPLQPGLDMAAINAQVVRLRTSFCVCVCVCDEFPDLPLSPCRRPVQSLYLQHHRLCSSFSFSRHINFWEGSFTFLLFQLCRLSSQRLKISCRFRSVGGDGSFTQKIRRELLFFLRCTHSLVCKLCLLPSPPPSPCAAEDTTRRCSRTENTYSRRDDKWWRIQMRLLLLLQAEQETALRVILMCPAAGVGMFPKLPRKRGGECLAS